MRRLYEKFTFPFNRRFSGVRARARTAHSHTMRASRLLSPLVSRPIAAKTPRLGVARLVDERVREKGEMARALHDGRSGGVGRAKKQVGFTKWRSTFQIRNHIVHDTRIVSDDVGARVAKRGLISRARVRVTVLRLGIGTISRGVRR